MKRQAAKDVVTDFHGATIQHGPLNRRIYLMDLNGVSPDEVVPKLSAMAEANRYTKIFAKVPQSQTEPFYRAGYRREASVPLFFKGKEDAAFLGLYLRDTRRAAANPSEIHQVIETAKKKPSKAYSPMSGPSGLEIRQCRPEETEEMSRLYGEVFLSYPFPIHDPGYLRETMQSHVAYFCAEHRGRIVALSSAEMDEKNGNVEMTDFATHPHWRGRRLATHLLRHMEKEMQRRDIFTAYTISRAASYAINVTFSTMGYTYGGLLINNTNIGGQIESMVVWHKRLGARQMPF
jgi:putative beta-lysine N-acetyltransferase